MICSDELGELLCAGCCTPFDGERPKVHTSALETHEIKSSAKLSSLYKGYDLRLF